MFRTYTATVDLIPSTELVRKGEKRGRREGGQMGLGSDPRTQGKHLGRRQRAEVQLEAKQH